MKKNLDNRELNIINRFLHGDHEAYSLLYKEHVQELFSYGKAWQRASRCARRFRAAGLVEDARL